MDTSSFTFLLFKNLILCPSLAACIVTTLFWGKQHNSSFHIVVGTISTAAIFILLKTL